MKIIAHRGLLKGPNQDKENTFEGVKKCFELGFDVEIDVRYDEKLDWFNIGHDNTIFQGSLLSLFDNKDKLWIHTKDIKTFEHLRENDKKNELNYFYHTNEDFVLTSQGHIWAYPGKFVKNSVWLFPERELEKLNYEMIKNKLNNHIGVCTDYPLLIKHIIES
jgi:hypothetical protein